jgi:hypothetical protein
LNRTDFDTGWQLLRPISKDKRTSAGVWKTEQTYFRRRARFKAREPSISHRDVHFLGTTSGSNESRRSLETASLVSLRPTASILQKTQKPIVLIDEYHSGLNRLVAQLEAHNNDLLLGFDQMRACPIHTDYARPTLSGYNVGLQAGARRIADNQNSLSGPKARLIDQLLVDCNAAYVFQISFGDNAFMNL